MGTACTSIVQVTSKTTKENGLFNFSFKEFSNTFTISITYMGLSI